MTPPKRRHRAKVKEDGLPDLKEIKNAARQKFKEGDRVRVVIGRFNPLVELESYPEGVEGTVIKSPVGSSVVQLRLNTPEMQEIVVSQLHLDVTRKAHRGSLDGTPGPDEIDSSEPTSPLHGLGKALGGLEMFQREDTPEGALHHHVEGDPDEFIKSAHQKVTGSPNVQNSPPLVGSPPPVEAKQLIDAGFDRLKRSSVDSTMEPAKKSA